MGIQCLRIREIRGPTALICMYWTVENYDQRFTEAEAPGIEDPCNREFLEQGPGRFSDSRARIASSIDKMSNSQAYIIHFHQARGREMYREMFHLVAINCDTFSSGINR